MALGRTLARLSGLNLRVETSPFHMERSLMKIHLRQIPQGGTLHVEGDEDAGFLDLEEADAHALFAPRV